jgi:hypothetical protein
LRYTWASARPNVRIDEILSFMPLGILSSLPPVRTQKKSPPKFTSS